MIQDIYPKHLDNSYLNKREAAAGDSIFVFRGKNKRDMTALMKINEEGGIVLPAYEELPEGATENLQYLFSIDETGYFLYPDDSLELDGYEYDTIRNFRFPANLDVSYAGMTAYHLYNWYITHRFCGRCGAPTEHHHKERAMRCPECGEMFFPVIAPAVIVGVTNGDSLLVSRYNGRAYKGIALIAGFCEIGETVEETVIREVMEEVGLKVKNLKYFGNQPWGIDANLLLGYFCEVDGDTTITIDEEELSNAEWLPRNEIPAREAGDLISLTGTMIETFRTGKA